MWITNALRQCIGMVFGQGPLCACGNDDLGVRVDLVTTLDYVQGEAYNNFQVLVHDPFTGAYAENISGNAIETIINTVPLLGEAQAFVGSGLGLVQGLCGIPGPF